MLVSSSLSVATSVSVYDSRVTPLCHSDLRVLEFGFSASYRTPVANADYINAAASITLICLDTCRGRLMGIRMQQVNAQATRVYMGTIMNEELHPAFVRLMIELNIRAGSVQLMGGLTDIEFRNYDILTKTRRAPILFSGGLELVTSHGNLSYLDGSPHVHLHATVTVPHSGVWVAGGHVQRAMAFAVEFILHAYDGDDLIRRFDEETGLSLWEQPEI
jgi:predicted DNA-binding protein with PD1-like motif